MRVTKFQYPLEKNYIQKIDLMIDRCIQKNPKRDSVLLIEGEEGSGKSSLSVATAYYVAEKTGRKFNHENMFFDVEKMIKFIQDNDDAIAIWDEPALQALTTDFASQIIKNLTRLLMMCRKKRHFIIINMTYFNKFTDYIVWQRPLAMVHLYFRATENSPRLAYIRKKNLEKLYQDWRTKKKRNYHKYSSKKVRGHFSDVLNPTYKYNVLSDFNLQYYEDEKDKAIQSVGSKPEILKAKEIKLLKLQYKLTLLPPEVRRRLNEIGITSEHMGDWREIPQKYPFILDNLIKSR